MQETKARLDKKPRLVTACAILLQFVLSIMVASSVSAQKEFPERVEDPLAKPPVPAPLSATLSNEEITASGTLSSNGSTIELTVCNNGNRSLLIDGDRASVREPKVPATSHEEVIVPPPRQQVTGDLKDVAVSIGSMGVVGVVQDEVRRHRSPYYYGKDEKRRDLAEVRFGPRILFPGENTKGRVWLKAAVKSPVELVIPVTVHPEGNDVGLLTVRIQPESHPAPVAPAARSSLDKRGKRQ